MTAEGSTLTASGQDEARPISDPIGELTYSARHRRLLVGGLILIVFAAFSSSLSGDFIHDDLSLIRDNDTLGKWDRESITRVFTRDSWAAAKGDGTSGPESFYYRPIFVLCLKLAYGFAGSDPARWHLINVLLHAASVVLAFLVLEKSLSLTSGIEGWKLGFLSALGAAVFAVHPVQVETVAWISGMVGPLGTSLLLGALYCQLVSRTNGGRWRVGAVLLFTVAVITKESALSLVPIVAAYELFLFGKGLLFSQRCGAAARRVAPFVIVTLGYFVLRHAVLGVFVGRGLNLNFPDDASITLLDNLRTIPVLLLAYIRLVIFPFELSPLYELAYVRSIGAPAFWLPLLVVIVIGVLILRFSKRSLEARLALVLMIIPIAPHLNTRAFVSDEIIHDRYLYLSMLGVGLLAATALLRVSKRIRPTLQMRGLAVATAALLFLLVGMTVAQCRVWASSTAMWGTAAARTRNSRTVLIALGVIAEQEGKPDDALKDYEAALRVNPNIIDALNNSGFVYAQQNRWPEAVHNFERIASLTPNKAQAHFNLSFAYGVQGRLEDAIIEQRTALELEPTGPRAGEWRARLAQLQKATQARVAAGP